MKKFLLVAFVVLFGISSAVEAQENDITDVSQLATKEASIENRDRLVMDFNFDNWRHKQGDGFETKWFSRGFSFYVMYDFQLAESKFSIAGGAGISSTNVFYNAVLVEDSMGVNFDLDAYDDDTYKKSKLSVTYLDVPVEFRFRSKKEDPSRSFKLAIGFKAGLKLDAKTKIKQEINNENKIFKNKRWEDVQTFRYGPTFRIGYGPVNAIIFYSLSDLFSKDRGPEMIPFSVGISLNGL